ncbi:MAG: glycosyltransferase, partial [Muribaculaceae bacterium]|nr:glycosyltransferase [Muribaculaceae bacterium]
MLFSVITVCYNADNAITPTLLSVAEQDFADFEHIIMDGASTDSTVDLCRQHSLPQTRL